MRATSECTSTIAHWFPARIRGSGPSDSKIGSASRTRDDPAAVRERATGHDGRISRSGAQGSDLGSIGLASWSEQEQGPGEDHVRKLVHREPDLIVLARGDRGAERQITLLALDDHPGQAAQGEAGEGEKEEHEGGV